MAKNPFVIQYEDLPEVIPLFPLDNAVVMPRCHLPLNIFEERYINMILDSLKNERIIGMVLPESVGKKKTIYKTGTAGRIISFNENSDGKLLIILEGICRFDIKEEVRTDRGYSKAKVLWNRFSEDYKTSACGLVKEREAFLALLKDYFDKKGLQTDWSSLTELPTPILVNALTGQLPLETPEKQALIESITSEERLHKLIHLLEFDIATNRPTSTRH